jgi:DNA-binding GntR family transcriptional regulator
MTLRDLVIDEIQSDLTQGRLQPGDSLDQPAIAKRLGVSRTPVREALVLLEAHGIVESHPRRGMVIRALSPDEVEDDYLVLATLEKLAAGLAVPRLTDGDLAQMKALLAQADVLIENGMYDEVHRVNQQFHKILYEAARRPRLIQFLEANLWSHTRHYNLLFIDLPDAAAWRLDKHSEILEACQKRDVASVETLVFHDVLDAGMRVANLLRQREEQRGGMPGVLSGESS